jgi:2-methylisocitrate lyase-like PEP mutase family enzyme
MVVAPGAFNGMTARMVEQAGFPAVYMTGGGTSLAHGYPDMGLLTLTEMADNAGMMARSVRIPVVADADTGYGNELNITRTVREYEQRGVAGMHLEDQVMPKRCGHMEGKQVVPRAEYLANIRAAVAARSDPDFLLIARTDSRAVLGFDEAITRVNEALALGADMAFVEAPQTLEEIASIPRLVRGACLMNIAPGGRSPSVSVKDAEAMGYRLAIVPGVLLTAVIEACDAALADLKAHRYPPADYTGLKVGDMFRRFGADEWDALRQT